MSETEGISCITKKYIFGSTAIFDKDPDHPNEVASGRRDTTIISANYRYIRMGKPLPKKDGLPYDTFFANDFLS